MSNHLTITVLAIGIIGAILLPLIRSIQNDRTYKSHKEIHAQIIAEQQARIAKN